MTFAYAVTRLKRETQLNVHVQLNLHNYFLKFRVHRQNLPRGVYGLELVLLVRVLKGRADGEGQEGGVARRTDGEDGLRLAVDVPV